MDDRPIGVLDSGVGGLTVWKEIIAQHPHESTVYIGDSLNAPYGRKTPEEIRALAGNLIRFLLSHDAKLIVVACNTITVNGIDLLRKEFPQIPLIGTVPVIKTAASKTKKKKIGVLVTKATEHSEYNHQLIDQFAPDCEVITIGTNKLVPLIEARNNAELPQVIIHELDSFKKQGVDVVVLGSTHFPILRPYLQEFLGPEVLLLDSGGAVARQTGRILAANNLQGGVKTPLHRIFTTGHVDPFQKILEQLVEGAPQAVSVVVQ